MKLVTIKLYNFRQYYGEQIIRFAQDPYRNVTVIHGANGAGKTGLFTALVWVLYGTESIPKVGELVNKRALTDAAIGQVTTARVELTFLQSGQKYLAVRTLARQRLQANHWTDPREEFTLSRFEPGGRADVVSNPTGEIEAILPSPVRTYFFFDGEKIDQFARPGSEDEVQQAVRNVLKIEVLDRAERHLDAVAREYQKELAKVSSGDLQALVEEEESRRSEFDMIQTSLRQKGEELRVARRQLFDINARLEEVRAAHELTEHRKALETGMS